MPRLRLCDLVSRVLRDAALLPSSPQRWLLNLSNPSVDVLQHHQLYLVVTSNS